MSETPIENDELAELSNSNVNQTMKMLLGKNLWRKANKWSNSLYYHLQPIFSASVEAPTPSNIISNIGQRLFKILEERNNSNVNKVKLKYFNEFQEILQECCDIDSLLQVINNKGYNLLQTATEYGDIAIVDSLISEGASPDSGKCSSPLHIACSKGDLQLVLHLLTLGANLSKKSGMCWPKSHLPVRHVPSRFHFLETDIYMCDTNAQLPLMCAIERDHVIIVKEIWQVYRPINSYPLHCAAKNGSLQCVEYLIFKEEIDKIDDEAMTPLMHGVSSSIDVTKALLDAGADVHCQNENGGILHHLFKNLQNPLELYDVTKLLLGHGLDTSINILDKDKNTALHGLVVLCNRKLETLSGVKSDQSKFDVIVVRTIELLLLHNVDVNSVNSSGVTALHKLLLTFDFVLSNDPRAITVDTLPQRECYEINMDVLNACVSMLGQHRADVCSLTAAGRAPIVIVLQSVLGAQLGHLKRFSNGLVDILRILCTHGAKPSLHRNTHNLVVATITKLSEKCIQNLEISEFTLSIYETLFDFDLDPNRTGQPPANLLAQTIRTFGLAKTENGVNFVCKIVQCLLQHSVNPDIEPYALDPEFCSSQSCVFLRKSSNGILQLAIDELQSLPPSKASEYASLELLHLLCNSVSHSVLYSLSKRSLATINPKLKKILLDYTEQPRSLKQCTRVIIYKQLRRKLLIGVDLLPLPDMLKRYLLYVQ
ncbi:DgyrCDS651 [Dimorphilus gyrociliatus]|uniref:DgyrCDS651 n=1 Tax=Dimorphilus gyrociliatus TaxID=2664684 RepID=A0A7I8V6V1_9ANNE|nr:DgyrCDS651 [Dimorphilus gyrociliatus]